MAVPDRRKAGVRVSTEPGQGDAAGDGGVRIPKYYELKQRLREGIEGLSPGTALKPERVLSREFHASRTTVRQALTELAVEGRIVRLQGRGTFVAPPKVSQSLQLTSYTQDMRAQGRTPGSRLLEMRVEPADADVAPNLDLADGVPIIRLERLRTADGVPMALEVVHLQAERFPGLTGELTDDTSLYALLRERYDVEPATADETIETVLASPSVASLLGTETGTPMLLLTRTTRDTAERPFEFVRSIYRGDRYRFVTRLEPPGR
jgi:GntR family transcriptional regulator